MKSNYKKLGPFIRDISVKNKNLNVELLLGVSITKQFIPSIANIVGTDMSNYKIVKRDQFAYGPVTSRNSEKISVALLTENECLVSTSYTVFEIIDTELLDPEYLMMWFRRPEFDRYARYMSHGTVREQFRWEEMCDIKLPIPSIEKQHEVVREYNVVNDRILLNEKLNQKLATSLQNIYEHWFVDFEFPISKEYAQSIGRPDIEGQPYKSFGGEMTYCEELEKDIPMQWQSHKLESYCDITFSKRIYQSEYVSTGVPFYRSREVILKRKGKQITFPLYISHKRYEEIINKFGAVSKGDILITAVGTIGITYMVNDEEFYIKDGNMFWLRNFKDQKFNAYIYSWMQSKEFNIILEEITYGSTQSVITTTDLCKQCLVKPNEVLLTIYAEIFLKIHNEIVVNNSIKYQLFSLKQLVLAKMSKA